jgi:NADPH:quinone reductase
MKAAYIDETGPPEKIIYGDLPKPQPQGSEVLVKVNAVSVNPVDTYIRNGANYWDLPQPFIIGCDLAGVVEAVGPEATQFQPGDRVWGTNQGLVGRQGTFAEYCAVDQQWLYSIPDGVDDEAAADRKSGVRHWFLSSCESAEFATNHPQACLRQASSMTPAGSISTRTRSPGAG